MKKILIGFSIFAMIAFIAMPTYALPYTDYVDIGDLESESGHNLVGWGPVVEPASGWGGGSSDGTLRVISHPGDGQIGTEIEWASIDLQFDGIGISALHLEGLARDSFYMYMDTLGDPTDSIDDEIFYWPGDSQSTEYWVQSSFSISPIYGKHTVYFLSDQPHWSGWGTYGQVAISSIGVEPIPEPATMFLLGSGLVGLAGARRKFKK